MFLRSGACDLLRRVLQVACLSASGRGARCRAFPLAAPRRQVPRPGTRLNSVTQPASRRVEELEKESESVSPPDIGSMERCNVLLQDLRCNPLAEWFLEPVDHVNLGLTDYPQVCSPGTCRPPMNLSKDMRCITALPQTRNPSPTPNP